MICLEKESNMETELSEIKGEADNVRGLVSREVSFCFFVCLFESVQEQDENVRRWERKCERDEA